MVAVQEQEKVVVVGFVFGIAVDDYGSSGR